jgi:acetyl esterase/lipase
MASPPLFTYGFVALLLTINALRRLPRPNAPLPPLWLPAMLTSSLAPFWLLFRLAIGAALVAAGGTRLAMGRLGLWMLGASMIGLCIVIARDQRSARALRDRIRTPLFSESLPTLLTGRPIPTPADIEQVDEIPYDDSNTFDLIRPIGPSSGRPAFVYVHGGGWTGGGPQKQARRMYHSLARAGWVVVAVRYPFAPAATICDQVLAIKRSLRRLVDRADDYGIDRDHIVLSGSSAGGHLAALTALRSADDLGGDAAEVDLAGCVPMYGIYDMANRDRTRPDWPYVDRDVMRGSYREKPDEFHAVSPVDHVRRDAPPFLVIHGTHDSLVPIAEAEVFVDAMRQAGAAVDFVRVMGAQHGFDAVSSNVSRHVGALVATWVTELVDEKTHTPDH